MGGDAGRGEGAGEAECRRGRWSEQGGEAVLGFR